MFTMAPKPSQTGASFLFQTTRANKGMRFIFIYTFSLPRTIYNSLLLAQVSRQIVTFMAIFAVNYAILCGQSRS